MMTALDAELITITVGRLRQLEAENARLRLRISELEAMIDAGREDQEMSYAEAVLGLR